MVLDIATVVVLDFGCKLVGWKKLRTNMHMITVGKMNRALFVHNVMNLPILAVKVRAVWNITIQFCAIF